jgi:protein arginine N-methyltransferase 1
MSFVLDEHLSYVADAVRLERFKAAFGKVVKRGDCIADLGSGSGILGLLCLQAGADRVHFVDDSAMIDIARQTLTRAGLDGKATFIHGRSEQISLPELADIVVCDHVGYFGFDYGIVRLLRDARRRFLKPGGALVPASVELQIAAIESLPCHKLAQGWCAQGIPAEFHWLREYSVNAKHAVNLKPEELLGEPATLGRIDFGEDHPELFTWTVELRMERDGLVHGLGGWFDCELAQGVSMSNSPLAQKPIQRPQVFLPIAEAVPVKTGDRVKATVMARAGDELIAWKLEFLSAGKRYSHSTWEGMLLAPQDLLQSNPTRVPQPNRAGLARAIVLGYCDGRRTAREIEQAVLLEHPGLFPSAEEISRFVARVLHRDTQ